MTDRGSTQGLLDAESSIGVREFETPRDIATALADEQLSALVQRVTSRAVEYRQAHLNQPLPAHLAGEVSTLVERSLERGGRPAVALCCAALLDFRLSQLLIADVFAAHDNLDSGLDNLASLTVTDPTHSLVGNVPQHAPELAAFVRVLDQFEYRGQSAQLRQSKVGVAIVGVW